MKFYDVENLFLYHYPSGKIIQKYEDKNYAFIYYSYRGKRYFTYCTNDGNWNFHNLIFKTNIHWKLFNNKYFVNVKEINSKDVFGVVVESHFLDNESIILDSLSSNFDKIQIGPGKYDYAYIAIVKSKPSSDYTIVIDGVDYKPFK